MKRSKTARGSCFLAEITRLGEPEHRYRSTAPHKLLVFFDRGGGKSSTIGKLIKKVPACGMLDKIGYGNVCTTYTPKAYFFSFFSHLNFCRGAGAKESKRSTRQGTTSRSERQAREKEGGVRRRTNRHTIHVGQRSRAHGRVTTG